MLRVLFGVGTGFLLFTYSEVRQINADLLRAACDVWHQWSRTRRSKTESTNFWRANMGTPTLSHLRLSDLSDRYQMSTQFKISYVNLRGVLAQMGFSVFSLLEINLRPHMPT